MEDYIILKAGYNQAVEDIINVLNEEIIKNPIIKDKILRKQREYLVGNTEYEGYLYKHYDEVNKIGYILFDDIHELKGIKIDIEKGTYIELNENELLYVRNENPVVWCDTFKNKDLINLKYEELLSKWKKI